MTALKSFKINNNENNFCHLSQLWLFIITPTHASIALTRSFFKEHLAHLIKTHFSFYVKLYFHDKNINHIFFSQFKCTKLEHKIAFCFHSQNWWNNFMFLDFTKHFGSVSYLKKYLVKNQNTHSKLISTHFLRPTKMLTVAKA